MTDRSHQNQGGGWRARFRRAIRNPMLDRANPAQPLPKVMPEPHICRVGSFALAVGIYLAAWIRSATAPPPTQARMHLFSANRRTATPEQRREHARYLAQRMAPMIRALMVMAVFVYVLATVARSILGAGAPTALAWRLLPVLPLVLVAVVARRTVQPLPLSLLALACLLLLEIGINLNTIGHVPGQPWVPPGLLLPVASSMIWSGRWDFIVAMVLCALGPLPMLWLGGVDPVHVIQYVVYMGVAISLSAVLRAFMGRTLLEQLRLEQQLREQANTDGLTGLLLRNRFLELARGALSAMRHQQQPVSMLYLDADHFKQLNDDYGHAAGDAALVALASALRAQSRQADLIGRMGGEEFALLLPGANLQQARRRAEQLRLAVRMIQRPNGPLTVSTGVAECTLDDGDDVEMLLARADQAMRQAKTCGRDRIVNA